MKIILTFLVRVLATVFVGLCLTVFYLGYVDNRVIITEPITTLPTNETCIDYFDQFAFSTPDTSGHKLDFMPPQSPWTIEAKTPANISIPYGGEVEIARVFSDYTEVWVRIHPWSFTDPSDGLITRLWVYRTDTQEWTEIPTEIPNSGGIFADELFNIGDGRIWGKNMLLGEEVPDGTPALSLFNDITHQFEFVPGTAKILQQNIDVSDWYNFGEVLVDARGIIWFFVYKDAIYSYDPVDEKTLQHNSLAYLERIHKPTISPNGRFYFKSSKDVNPTRVEPGEIIEFIPSTGELNPILIPEEPWSKYSRLLADRRGRLWTDIFGWRDVSGQWVKFHPQMSKYIRINEWDANYLYYEPPAIFLESSDGRLWFYKYRTSESPQLRSGIAWYDPETNEGCWFTNEGTNIIEDSNHFLWMFTEGVLYRRSVKTARSAG